MAASKGATIEDAVDELKELVKIGDLANDLQRATQSILMTLVGAAKNQPPAPGGASPNVNVPTTKGPDLVPRMEDGFGKWLKHKVRTKWQSSRIGRGVKTGRAAGTGIGKTLGLGARGVAGLGAAGAVAGGVTAAITAVVVGFIEARKAVDQWTEAAFATARRLSEISGSMAAIMAERDVYQMMRDLKRGEATAGSTRDLMGAESKRKDAENRLEIVFDNAKNSVLAVLNDMLTGVLEPLADFVEAIEEPLRAFIGAKKKDDPADMGVGAAAKAAVALMEESDKAARRLMDIARDAGARGGPPGGWANAAPFGRLP